MEKFFIKAGAYKDHKIEKHGRTFIVIFSYENGVAAYDGRGWTFALNNQE